MASIVVAGDTSGTVTLAAPAVSGTTTLTLPTTSGTIVTTSGSQTIEFADGSASTPSITNSGDTNTGMFFPAADTIAFAEGGAEAMRLDSAGNVGIGTTSPLNPIQTYKLGDFSSSTNNIRNLAYFQADATVANSSIIFNTNPTSGLNLRGFKIDYQSSAFAIGRFHTDKTTGFTPDLNITSDGLFQFNNGYGSVATAYGCRAWVNFNGTGTVAIRASGNVTSITDNGTGLYTINITTAISDANYSVAGAGHRVSGSYSAYINTDSSAVQTTSACKIASSNDTGALVDSAYITVAIFR
jgi:hypothetical protein